jgi:hypothetical protein
MITCPSCKVSEIEENDHTYFCSCGLRIWKKAFAHRVSRRELLTLLAPDPILEAKLKASPADEKLAAMKGCGKAIGPFDNLKGKSGKVFSGAIRLNEACNFVLEFEERLTNTTQRIPAGKKCPSCENGDLIKIAKPGNLPFLGCSNFPKCKYIEKLPPAGISRGVSDSKLYET